MLADATLEPPIGRSARWRRALSLVGRVPRPPSLGSGRLASAGAALGLAVCLVLLRVLGLWTLKGWWISVAPYSPLGQWRTGLVLALWSWYAAYATAGAWKLRAQRDQWLRRMWRPILIGCAASLILVFGFGVIVPGLL